MSDINTVNDFNTVPNILPYVQSFIGVVQAGRITINTDGLGHYWASVVQFSGDTGKALPNVIIPLNVTAGLPTAAADLATLQALLQQATVVAQPPSGAVIPT